MTTLWFQFMSALRLFLLYSRLRYRNIQRGNTQRWIFCIPAICGRYTQCNWIKWFRFMPTRFSKKREFRKHYMQFISSLSNGMWKIFLLWSNCKQRINIFSNEKHYRLKKKGKFSWLFCIKLSKTEIWKILPPFFLPLHRTSACKEQHFPSTAKRE